ncbi:hypothetical protein [Streptomyces sp. NPDC053367]|uniref:hypothetical protein n=1 Tax=Streptomyces sp. NPDC053367 TaxID=3365700 RepID=UPI0037D80FC0
MTAGRCARTLRSAVFAAVCVLLAALGHALMSGAGVPAGALAGGWAATTAAAWCLAGRERGLPLIVTAVTVAQAGLHEAFSYARPTPGHAHMHAVDAVNAIDAMSMGPMDMDPMAMSPSPSDAFSSFSSFSPFSPFSSSSGMLAAHLLAALLTGLWLAHGERAAFRILRAVAGRLAAPLRLLLALPPAPEEPRTGARSPGPDRAPGRLLVHAITSRGPPEGTAVA